MAGPRFTTKPRMVRSIWNGMDAAGRSFAASSQNQATNRTQSSATSLIICWRVIKAAFSPFTSCGDDSLHDRPVMIPETGYPSTADFQGQFASWRKEVPVIRLLRKGKNG